MFRTCFSTAILCCAVAVGSVALAQQPGGRPGGFGNFGGFGGGFGRDMGGSLTLLQAKEVQEDLQLLDEQKADLDKIREESRSGGGFREAFSGLQDLSEEERQAKMAEIGEKMRARAKEFDLKAEEVLLPQQIDRLKEISIQVRGVAALSEEEVATKLGLSDEQKQQLVTVREENDTQMRELFQPATGGTDLSDEERRARFTEMQEKSQQLRTERDEKLLAVLSAEQQQQFETMKGAKIEIDRSQFNRGGRGGRGGRPGFGRGGRPGEGERPGEAERPEGANPDT